MRVKAGLLRCHIVDDSPRLASLQRSGPPAASDGAPSAAQTGASSPEEEGSGVDF